MADGSSVMARFHGNVVIPFNDSIIRLKNVFFIPGLGYNLVSVGRLADNGISSLFKSKSVELRHEASGFIIGYGLRDTANKLYTLPNPFSVTPDLILSLSESSAKLWHRRLAHLNQLDLCNLHKHAAGIPELEPVSEVCRACRLGKAHKLSFKGKFKRTEALGDVIHSDVVGPV